MPRPRRAQHVRSLGPVSEFEGRAAPERRPGVPAHDRGISPNANGATVDGEGAAATSVPVQNAAEGASPRLQFRALQLIAHYGDKSHLTDLEQLADDEMASATVREEAKRAIQAIKGR